MLETCHPELVPGLTEPARRRQAQRGLCQGGSFPADALAPQNANSEQELGLIGGSGRGSFCLGTADVSFVCESNTDGAPAGATRKSGASRHSSVADCPMEGDWVTGEDVTSNVRTIRSVPLSVSTERLHRAKPPQNSRSAGRSDSAG